MFTHNLKKVIYFFAFNMHVNYSFMKSFLRSNIYVKLHIRKFETTVGENNSSFSCALSSGIVLYKSDKPHDPLKVGKLNKDNMNI